MAYKLKKEICDFCGIVFEHTEKSQNFCGLLCRNRYISKQNKGKKNYKISISKIGEKNSNWLGDKVGLSGVHLWLKRRYKKPEFCQDCRKNKAMDLANISGNYKRDINDFEWLCRHCHMSKDGRLEKLKQMARERNA